MLFCNTPVPFHKGAIIPIDKRKQVIVNGLLLHSQGCLRFGIDAEDASAALYKLVQLVGGFGLDAVQTG